MRLVYRFRMFLFLMFILFSSTKICRADFAFRGFGYQLTNAYGLLGFKFMLGSEKSVIGLTFYIPHKFGGIEYTIPEVAYETKIWGIELKYALYLKEVDDEGFKPYFDFGYVFQGNNLYGVGDIDNDQLGNPKDNYKGSVNHIFTRFNVEYLFSFISDNKIGPFIGFGLNIPIDNSGEKQLYDDLDDDLNVEYDKGPFVSFALGLDFYF